MAKKRILKTGHEKLGAGLKTAYNSLLNVSVELDVFKGGDPELISTCNIARHVVLVLTETLAEIAGREIKDASMYYD